MSRDVPRVRIGAFAFPYGWPALIITTCILLAVTKQPRWASAAGIALTVVAGLAYVAIWFLFGDSNFRESYAAMAVCAVAGMGVVGIGVERLLS